MGNLGAKWRRPFRFFIPVRNPDFWSSKEICPLLQQALGFLSEDTYIFEFSKLTGGDPINEYLEFAKEGDKGFNADEVVLFSGGLDSLAGAIKEAVIDNLAIALISHRASPKVDDRQRNLVQELKRFCTRGDLFHVPVWVQKDKSLWRESTQRTRSFLYASIAATVARMFGLSRIRFYENGITSMNFPISEQVIGTRASRTTHPQVLNAFALLFSKLTGSTFIVENPFIWKTKTDLVQSIGDAGCAELIRDSISCTHAWQYTKSYTHCGRCSQCIDRRFAALATSYADYDPADRYKLDLLTGPREMGQERTMLESYARTAIEFGKMSDTEFFTRFIEATRVLRHLGGTSNQTGTNVYDLHKRHAEQIGRVLTSAWQKYAPDILETRLPESCLIILSLPDDYRTLVKPIDVRAGPTFVKDGEKWTLSFEGKTVYMDHRIGMEYIAYLLHRSRKEIRITELYYAVTGLPVSQEGDGLPYGQMTADQLAEEGMAKAGDTPPETLVDEKTVSQCKRKIAELKEELRVAVSKGDSSLVVTVKEDLEYCQKYLRSSTDVRGRPRQIPDTSEKIRKSVSNAISRALEAIRQKHEALGQHLNCISTGDYALYNPDTSTPWQL